MCTHVHIYMDTKLQSQLQLRLVASSPTFGIETPMKPRPTGQQNVLKRDHNVDSACHQGTLRLFGFIVISTSAREERVVTASIRARRRTVLSAQFQFWAVRDPRLAALLLEEL